MREVGGGHDDAAGALAVRRAGNIVGRSGRLEGGNGFDGDRRLRKKGEELREFEVHLSNVAAEIVEDLLRRTWNVLGIRFERCAERGKIGETLLFGDHQHRRLDAVDLAETELVYLVRRHAGGGPRVDVVFVALLAVWQRGDREGGTALRGVYRAQKISEALVGRDDVDVDLVSDLLGQALLVFGGDARGILFCRDQKRVGVDDALTLDGKLLQDESDGHELVLHASAKDFGGLAEDAGNLVKSGDVVLVVLDGVEGNGQR